jgi:hypothetical protein
MTGKMADVLNLLVADDFVRPSHIFGRPTSVSLCVMRYILPDITIDALLMLPVNVSNYRL